MEVHKQRRKGLSVISKELILCKILVSKRNQLLRTKTCSCSILKELSKLEVYFKPSEAHPMTNYQNDSFFKVPCIRAIIFTFGKLQMKTKYFDLILLCFQSCSSVEWKQMNLYKPIDENAETLTKFERVAQLLRIYIFVS